MPGVDEARRVARPGASSSAPDELGADDHVGLARLEELDRAPVEVGVAEVDLVADARSRRAPEDALFSALP